MISGLNNELLDFVSNQSGSRYLKELDMGWINEMIDLNESDFSLTIEQENSLKELESYAQPKTTKDQTRKWVNELKVFLKKENLSEDFETVPTRVLNDYFRIFYSSLRKNDGSFYAPSSLVCIRAAIHRHLTSPEVNSSVNILTDDQFRRSNAVLKAMVKKYLTSDQDEQGHYERIQDSDMEKISAYFESKSDIITLQEECLFNIMLHFQLRGRENLRCLTQDSFGFSFESNREFAFIKVPLLQKNVKASVNRKEFENLKGAKMVSQPNLKQCPVSKLKKYLSLLTPATKGNALFPCIKKDGSFSTMTVIGKDKLGGFLSSISLKAGLSKKYTNHCLRVTGINVMHDAGMSPEEIASVTGHKTTASVQRYIRRDNKKLITASDILTAASTSAPATVQRQNIIMSQMHQLVITQKKLALKALLIRRMIHRLKRNLDWKHPGVESKLIYN